MWPPLGEGDYSKQAMMAAMGIIVIGGLRHACKSIYWNIKTGFFIRGLKIRDDRLYCISHCCGFINDCYYSCGKND